MIYVVESFEFNSSACFEVIEVLDIMKIAFDDDDIETLKEFVKRNLVNSRKTHFVYPGSGRRTNHANLATIIKIGIALMRLLGSPGAAASQDSQTLNSHEYEFHMLDEEEQQAKKQAAAAAATASQRSFEHLNDGQWSTFCERRLKHFESKWTKKLEDYTEEDNKEAEFDDGTHDGDETKAQVLSEKGPSGLSRSMTVDPKSGESLLSSSELEEKKPKDDWSINEKSESGEFLANQYWKTPEQYSLDDLLKEEMGA